jgi:hypothetical protein
MAIPSRYAKGLCSICHSQQILADFTTPGFKNVAISRFDGRDMLTVAQPLCEVPTLANLLDAES